MPWNPHNLTVHGGAPIAIGAPVSHVFAVEGTQHVFHRSFYGEHAREGLIELWWRPGEKPQSGDLFADVGDDAGVAVWLACHTVEAERTQHVFYGQPAITELWWPTSGAVRAGNLATQAGQPELSGFALTSHVFLEEGTQHVFFIASGQIDGTPVDGHVGELWWHSSDPTQVVDLTERAGGAPAPESASTLASHVVEGQYTPERSQHVFYWSGRDIFELRWGADAVTTPRNLTARSAGENEPAVSAPASHVDPDGTQHVFYVDDGAQVIELTWQGMNDPLARNLSAHSIGNGPAPFAISPPTSHLFLREGTHHVYDVGQGNHLIELWWYPGGQPHHEDLTAQSGDTSLAGSFKPASHVFDAEGTQHVFYTSTSDEIVELWWRS